MYTHERCSARSGTCVRRVADFAARKSEEKRHWRTDRTVRGIGEREGENDESRVGMKNEGRGT